jgi:hypothetical protein
VSEAVTVGACDRAGITDDNVPTLPATIPSNMTPR